MQASYTWHVLEQGSQSFWKSWITDKRAHGCVWGRTHFGLLERYFENNFQLPYSNNMNYCNNHAFRGKHVTHFNTLASSCSNLSRYCTHVICCNDIKSDCRDLSSHWRTLIYHCLLGAAPKDPCITNVTYCNNLPLYSNNVTYGNNIPSVCNNVCDLLQSFRKPNAIM